MYVTYVQATGVQEGPNLQEHCSPDASLHWIPLPVPLSCGELPPVEPGLGHRCDSTVTWVLTGSSLHL